MRKLTVAPLIKKRAAPGVIASVLTAVLLSMACLTGPSNEITPAGPPWEPVDSAWKVIENLQFAYNNMDLDLYMSCFREDFEFHLLWYNPHGNSAMQDSFWGFAVEELIHQNMFAYVYSIELTIEGTQESPWTGDTTGQSYQLPRIFDLWVYTNEAQSEGYRAAGSALFICRPDSTDDQWYIWQWWDLSHTKESTTWGALKALFY